MLAFQQGIICLDTDLEILGEVGVAHVAGIHECVMEGERALEVYRSLTCNTKTQIFVQKRPVFGRSAVVDDCASSVDRIEVTEIGDALVGYDHVDGVLAVVGMRNHRHDIGDKTALAGGGAGENGEVCVAGEVARATDTIHHLRSADMCGIDITINICFDGSIDRDNTETADYFRAV